MDLADDDVHGIGEISSGITWGLNSWTAQITLAQTYHNLAYTVVPLTPQSRWINFHPHRGFPNLRLERRSFMPDNNMIEQDHRFIKRRIRHMCGYKSFRSASAIA
jgi:transposase-like protein